MASTITTVLLSGCDCDVEEILTPNDELVPSQLSKLNENEFTIRKVDDLNRPTEEEALDHLNTMFLAVMSTATRNSSPKGIDNYVRINVQDSVSNEDLAKFFFSLNEPLISNDGREYSVADENYARFLKNIVTETTTSELEK